MMMLSKVVWEIAILYHVWLSLDRKILGIVLFLSIEMMSSWIVGLFVLGFVQVAKNKLSLLMTNFYI